MPAAVPVMLTEMVQVAPAARVPPAISMTVEPKKVTVELAQVLVRPLGVLTISPVGRVSLNSIPVRVVPAFGLVTVKVRLVEPLRAIVGAPKALASEGGPTT